MLLQAPLLLGVLAPYASQEAFFAAQEFKATPSNTIKISRFI
jgi:hypothetical protein